MEKEPFQLRHIEADVLAGDHAVDNAVDNASASLESEAKLGRAVLELLTSGAKQGDIGFYAGSYPSALHFISYQYEAKPPCADVVAETLLSAMTLQDERASLAVTATMASCANGFVFLVVEVHKAACCSAQ